MTYGDAFQARAGRASPEPFGLGHSATIAIANELAEQRRADCLRRWKSVRPDPRDCQAWGIWLIDMSHDLERIEKQRQKEIFHVG